MYNNDQNTADKLSLSVDQLAVALVDVITAAEAAEITDEDTLAAIAAAKLVLVATTSYVAPE